MQAPVVTAARSWLGTPFHHQGRMKGVGVDCIGVVVGVCRDLSLMSHIQDANGAPRPITDFDQTAYAREPQGKLLEQNLDAFLDRISADSIEPGDVALFVMAKHPQHVGIFGDYVGGGLSLIHAYESTGRVCEHVFNDKWRRRLTSAYRFRPEAF